MPDARDYIIVAGVTVAVALAVLSGSLFVLWRAKWRIEFIVGCGAVLVVAAVLSYWLLWYKASPPAMVRTVALAGWVCAGTLGVWLMVRALGEMPSGSRHHSIQAERRRLVRNGIAVVAGVAVGRTIAAYDPADVTIEQHECVLPELPRSADGMRVVLIGDLHAGPFLEPKHLAYYIECIRRQSPDLCVIVGDFITASASDFRDFCRPMRELTAPLGVYAVLGNHDYFNGAAPTLSRMLNDCGVVLLDDQTVALDGIELFGISDHQRQAALLAASGVERSSLMEQLGQSACPIVLVHRPFVFDALAAINPRSLVLAGHTHGGQLALELGSNQHLTLTQLFSPYVRGWYHRGSAHLYVTRGLGTIGVPLRIGSPPEITTIVLRSHAA
jgi:predicted MPP superfamily phosphohydrolase